MKSDLSLVIPYNLSLWWELEIDDMFRLEQLMLEIVMSGKLGMRRHWLLYVKKKVESNE